MVLARKYRPRSFNDVVGQEHVLLALRNSLKQNRIHQAYLFTGTRGVGKTTLARILAKSLNCDSGITDEPCGCCSSCEAIDAGSFVDLMELDAATHTKVDDMRRLLDKVVYPPFSGRFKVYVIDEVHMLSNSAFNAMLKTLEEPPQHAKFILATTDPQKIPLAVLSRCLNFPLRCLSRQQIQLRMQIILHAESIPYDDGGLSVISSSAAGSLRDALSILDQAIAYGGGTVSKESVLAMLGVADFGRIIELVEMLASSNIEGALSYGREILIQGALLSNIYSWLMKLFHQMAVLHVVPCDETIDSVYRDRILALVGLYGPEDVQLFYQIVSLAYQGLDLSADPAILLDMLLIRLYAFAPQRTESNGCDILSVPILENRDFPNNEDLSLVGSNISRHDFPGDPVSQSDWESLRSAINFEGMIRQFVDNCTWCFSNGNDWFVRPNAVSKALFVFVQKRLDRDISEFFGRPIKVLLQEESDTTDGTFDGSVAHQLKEKRDRGYQEAVDLVRRDENVMEIINSLDGEVDVASIKVDGLV
ncbi:MULTISPECIES: DNA polymerase III subunit gamma/tau [Candidatus Ichthyocystis]|uniref:DNA polymerase III subunit gamma/tau n=1 Tax=Candidatus Ichthyocystis hellenicum TaxID=1561003 RepID=A0A0S4M7Q6_9BURK|nr:MULTISPECIES: DNA polymerase III subunit gamma/tau [Ichthyocystis]CUT17428.1 DNA polymerase III subunit gamma/tau [Candidatus Ichthyocystis hellenicum]